MNWEAILWSCVLVVILILLGYRMVSTMPAYQKPHVQTATTNNAQ